MSDDNDKPTSGNRWEPTDHPTEPVHPQAGGADAAVAPAAEVTPDPVPAYAPAKPGMPRRSKAIIAGAAAGLVLAGGLGGFALGAAVTGDDDGGRTDMVNVREGHGGPGGDLDGDGELGRGGGPFGQEGQAPTQPETGSDAEPGSTT